MTMPDQAAYRKLVAGLRDALPAFEGAQDDGARLAASRQALAAVLDFLECDPELNASFLLRPIFALKTAAYDRGLGAEPPLLKQASVGKPAGTSREVIQGILAYAVDLMKKTGLNNENALAWVVKEARNCRITDQNGSSIISKQIKSWRSEISAGRAPAEAKNAYEGMRTNPFNVNAIAQIKATRAAPVQFREARAQAERLAKLMIQSAATVAPLSAPRLHNKA